MTNVAILCLSKDSDIDSKIIHKLDADCNVFVYSKDRYESGVHGKVENVEIPAECDTLPKMHNFIVKDQHNRGYAGILHVVEDVVEVTSEVSKFFDDLSKLMHAIKLDVWLNTVCDGMNYVYSKYNPRLVIEFDEERWQKFGLDGIAFTSHSNAAWIAYNMANYSEAAFLFDEQFTARMFMIIEFLTRRKAMNAGKTSLCLMNMYPTVKSENGVFKIAAPYDEKVSDSVMKEENDKFVAMNLNITPDNLIDNVLEILYNIFKEKEG